MNPQDALIEIEIERKIYAHFKCLGCFDPASETRELIEILAPLIRALEKFPRGKALILAMHGMLKTDLILGEKLLKTDQDWLEDAETWINSLDAKPNAQPRAQPLTINPEPAA